MMLCVMMPLVVVDYQQSVSQCVKRIARLRRDNAASPDWVTPLNGIISPLGREVDHCKNNWKEPEAY